MIEVPEAEHATEGINYAEFAWEVGTETIKIGGTAVALVMAPANSYVISNISSGSIAGIIEALAKAGIVANVALSVAEGIGEVAIYEDRLGSISHVTDASGDIVDYIVFDPWGEIIVEPSMER